MPELVLLRFRMLEPPRDRLWADPFPVVAEGRHYILIEDCSYATNRGGTSVIALGEDGIPSAPVPVLERDYHLSYPFVFDWEGAHYMVPESSANATVDLYRATRFPYEWTHERTLMADTRLVDATLAEIDGRWWMFANAAAVPEALYGGSYWDELHLFFADSPRGPWTPHPRNPVVSDVRRARPAGRLFQRDRVWYRPAQELGGTLWRVAVAAANHTARSGRLRRGRGRRPVAGVASRTVGHPHAERRPRPHGDRRGRAAPSQPLRVPPGRPALTRATAVRRRATST